jgi:C4-dicarboxylate-specific signal transduction histidine kinase
VTTFVNSIIRPALKPCPFCGSEAFFNADHRAVKVQCSHEECEAETGCWYTLTQKGYELAASNWNKRELPQYLNKVKVIHLGSALQGIADQFPDVISVRQQKALYIAASLLWDKDPVDEDSIS